MQVNVAGILKAKNNRRIRMKKTTGRALPLARKEGLIIKELADEVLVYDRNIDRAHC